MVKTLDIDTEWALIVVQELSGFAPATTSQIHYELIRHVTGLVELPTDTGEVNDLLNPAGWDAIIQYTRFVQQTRCFRWKGEPLFTLPSQYAAAKVICAGFDAMADAPSAMLEAWNAGCKQVAKTERDTALEGKTSGE